MCLSTKTSAGAYFPACAGAERVLDSKLNLESGNCTPPEYLLVVLPVFRLFKRHPAQNLTHKHSPQNLACKPKICKWGPQPSRWSICKYSNRILARDAQYLWHFSLLQHHLCKWGEAAPPQPPRSKSRNSRSNLVHLSMGGACAPPQPARWSIYKYSSRLLSPPQIKGLGCTQWRKESTRLAQDSMADVKPWALSKDLRRWAARGFPGSRKTNTARDSFDAGMYRARCAPGSLSVPHSVVGMLAGVAKH